MNNTVKVTFKSTYDDDDAVNYIATIINYYIHHFDTKTVAGEGFTVETLTRQANPSEFLDGWEAAE